MELQAKLQAANPQSTGSNQAASASSVQAKLPKLIITKFNGTYADWPRFWGQFSETIDKTSVAPITKFAYLRELLDDKVKRMVETLPFTPEGYNRAKAILQDRFGKESEIVKAYVKEILELPYTPTDNPKKINEFYDKLNYNVQALQTLNKLRQVHGAVAMALDKLPAVRGDLVRTDPDWEEWNFAQLAEALRLWTRRNPMENLKSEGAHRRREKPSRVYQTQQRQGQLQPKPRTCAYCNTSDHKSSDCPNVTTSEERKKILSTKKLCLNCTGSSHRAAECRSTATCQHCARGTTPRSATCQRKSNRK